MDMIITDLVPHDTASLPCLHLRAPKLKKLSFRLRHGQNERISSKFLLDLPVIEYIDLRLNGSMDDLAERSLIHSIFSQGTLTNIRVHGHLRVTSLDMMREALLKAKDSLQSFVFLSFGQESKPFWRRATDVLKEMPRLVELGLDFAVLQEEYTKNWLQTKDLDHIVIAYPTNSVTEQTLGVSRVDPIETIANFLKRFDVNKVNSQSKEEFLLSLTRTKLVQDKLGVLVNFNCSPRFLELLTLCCQSSQSEESIGEEIPPIFASLDMFHFKKAERQLCFSLQGDGDYFNHQFSDPKEGALWVQKLLGLHDALSDGNLEDLLRNIKVSRRKQGGELTLSHARPGQILNYFDTGSVQFSRLEILEGWIRDANSTMMWEEILSSHPISTLIIQASNAVHVVGSFPIRSLQVLELSDLRMTFAQVAALNFHLAHRAILLESLKLDTLGISFDDDDNEEENARLAKFLSSLLDLFEVTAALGNIQEIVLTWNPECFHTFASEGIDIEVSRRFLRLLFNLTDDTKKFTSSIKNLGINFPVWPNHHLHLFCLLGNFLLQNTERRIHDLSIDDSLVLSRLRLDPRPGDWNSFYQKGLIKWFSIMTSPNIVEFEADNNSFSGDLFVNQEVFFHWGSCLQVVKLTSIPQNCLPSLRFLFQVNDLRELNLFDCPLWHHLGDYDIFMNAFAIHSKLSILVYHPRGAIFPTETQKREQVLQGMTLNQSLEVLDLSGSDWFEPMDLICLQRILADKGSPTFKCVIKSIHSLNLSLQDGQQLANILREFPHNFSFV